MRKRWISLLLTAAMVFGLCGPMGALVPEAEAANADEFSYEIKDGVARIYGTDLTGDVVFPSEIDGYPVKSLGCHLNSWLEADREKITSITIPSSVEIIERDTFSEYTNLKRVNLTDGLKTIGAYAFEDCSALEQIQIPETVTTIGDDAFSGTGLKNLSLPSSVENLGDSVFWASDLQSVTLPSNLQTIPSFMFWACQNLQSVQIPDSVQTIENYAFCSSGLRSITIPSSVRSVGTDAFRTCANLESVTFEGSDTELSESVFYGCKKLTSVTLPSRMTEVPNFLLQGCESLSSISLPANITSIGNRAFQDCISLKQISLPESVQTIRAWAFNGCSSIEKVYIPAAVQSIDETAFYMCPKLTDIYFGGTKAQWESVTKNIGSTNEIWQMTIHYNAEGLDQNPSGTLPDPTVSASVPTPILQSATYRNQAVTVEWSVPQDTASVQYMADGYQILRKTGDGEYAQIGTVSGKNTMQYVDNTVEQGKTYTYTVRAYYNGGSGVYDAKGISITCGTAATAAKLELDPTREMLVHYNLSNNQVVGLFSLEILAGFAGEVDTAAYQPGPVTLTVDLTGGFSFYPDETVQHKEFETETLPAPTESEPQPTVTENITIYIRNNQTGTIRITAQADTCEQATQAAYRPALHFLTVEEETWPIINAAFSFCYPSGYKIPVERYQEVYGERLGQIKARSASTWGGNCAGMAWTAGLIATRGLNLPYGFTGLPSHQGDGVTFGYVYWNQDSALTKLIERYQLFQTELMGMGDEKLLDLIGQMQNGEYCYQAADGSYDHNLDGNYIQSLCDVIESSTQPLVASIAWGTNAHDVLLTSNQLIDMGSGWYCTPIYDPNHPYLDTEVFHSKVGWEDAYDKPERFLFLNPEKNLFQAFVGDNGDGTEVVRGSADKETAITYDNELPDRLALFNVMDLAMTEIDPDQYLQYLTSNREQYVKLTYSDQSDLEVLSADGSKTLAKVENGQVTYLDDTVTELVLADTDGGALYIPTAANYRVQCDGSMMMETSEHITYLSGQGLNAVLDMQNNKVTLKGMQTGDATVLLSNLADSDEEIEAVEISGELVKDQTVSFTLNSSDKLVTTGENYWKDPEVQVLEETFTNVPQVDLSTTLDLTDWDKPQAFADIPSNAYYADAVQWAVEQGITTGTSSTSFSPDEPCTRAQVVTFLWRALGLDELSSRSTENPFRDVPSGAYYRDPVLWAAENGITTGTSATTFSPDDACTRAQVVTFLWRVDFPPKYYDAGQSFRDVRVSDYYWYPVQWAVERNITTGTSATTFSPNETCTRAQVVTFLYRDFA